VKKKAKREIVDLDSWGEGKGGEKSGKKGGPVERTRGRKKKGEKNKKGKNAAALTFSDRGEEREVVIKSTAVPTGKGRGGGGGEGRKEKILDHPFFRLSGRGGGGRTWKRNFTCPHHSLFFRHRTTKKKPKRGGGKAVSISTSIFIQEGEGKGEEKGNKNSQKKRKRKATEGVTSPSFFLSPDKTEGEGGEKKKRSKREKKGKTSIPLYETFGKKGS